MLVIPAQFSPSEYHLFVVLDDDGVERMRLHDPGEIPLGSLSDPFKDLVLRKFVLCYASDEEMERIAEWAKQGKLDKIIKLLTGGWRYRPDRGDGAAPQRLIGD